MRKTVFVLAAGFIVLAAPAFSQAQGMGMNNGGDTPAAAPASPGLDLQSLVKPNKMGLHYLRVAAPDSADKPDKDKPKTETAADSKQEKKPEPETQDGMKLIENSLAAIDKAQRDHHLTTPAGTIEAIREIRAVEPAQTPPPATAPAKDAPLKKGPDDRTRLFKNVSDYNQ